MEAVEQEMIEYLLGQIADKWMYMYFKNLYFVEFENI